MIQIKRGVHRFVKAANYARLHLGLTASGPQDRFSCELANRLLGNDRYAGAIEFTLAPVRVSLHRDCHFIVGGAPCELMIDGIVQPEWTVLHASAGSELRIRIGPTGCRVYLCVTGGLQEHGAFEGNALLGNLGRTADANAHDWEPPLGVVRCLPAPKAPYRFWMR